MANGKTYFNRSRHFTYLEIRLSFVYVALCSLMLVGVRDMPRQLLKCFFILKLMKRKKKKMSFKFRSTLLRRNDS